MCLFYLRKKLFSGFFAIAQNDKIYGVCWSAATYSLYTWPRFHGRQIRGILLRNGPTFVGALRGESPHLFANRRWFVLILDQGKENKAGQ